MGAGVKPYYEQDGITIYHGDCRGVLPELSCDIVVTSPPYNTLPSEHAPSGLHAERATGVNKWIAKSASGYFDQRPEDDYQAWLNNILGICLERARGLVWVNHKVRYRDGVALHPARIMPFPIYTEVIWDRGISMALNCKRYAPSHEMLLAFGKPHYWDDSLNTTMSVWRIQPAQGSKHPCPFPESLATRPIVSSCPPDGVVLDVLPSRNSNVACSRSVPAPFSRL